MTAQLSPLQAGPGRGAVAIVCHRGRSVVSRAYATSPLRLLTPANHGTAAWIYTSSFGGGLVDGDDIRLDIDVRQGAAAYLSTQSATKVYRSPHGTIATVHGVVHPRAFLVVAPDPVVPFAGARFRQRQCYDVSADGGLVVIDVLVSGRRASGERWKFVEYESRIEVAVGGRLRVYDPLALRAADGDLAARLGRFNVVATAIVAGGLLQADVARVLDLAAKQPAGRRSEQVLAASPVGDDACIVRLAGAGTEPACRTLRRLLQFVPSRLADDPWARKW